MTRIVTIALAAVLSTLALSAAQAGSLNGTSINGLSSYNGFEYTNGLDSYNGIGPNGLGSSNGIRNNGLGSYNGIILNGFSGNGLDSANGLGGSNGIGTQNGWSNGSLNGISVSETAGQAILEIRLPDGTVARR